MMINYFNFKKFQDKFLITNDFGRYKFLSNKEFSDLLLDRIDIHSELNKCLEKDYFTYSNIKDSFIENNYIELEKSKNYLFQSTSLHIFVVTTACNQQCVYCQAQNGKVLPHGMMTKEIARKAVDIALNSPSDNLDFEFQGGEPLMNFEIIKYIVEYTKSKTDKNVRFSIVSNLTLLNDEIIKFIKDNGISISTSLDGDRNIHNYNRPYRTGKGTYDDVMKSLEKLRSSGIYVGAIETTSKKTLTDYKSLIDTYVKLGFKDIFIRPLTPLGCAKEHWLNVGYTPNEFVEFYKNILNYILELNMNGYSLAEGHAKIFLKKILTGFSPNYMELRSPCGAALGQMAYYYDGNIFTCDEGRMLYEMGDDAFCIGNVFTSTYDSILDNSRCKIVSKASILESLPSCSDCVYQPYCGVCPVVNYATNNDVYEVSHREYRCQIYSGMLDTIFSYLYDDNNRIKEIFRSWIE